MCGREHTDGELVTTTFEVDITTSTPERTVFELTNPETGETSDDDRPVVIDVVVLGR